MLLRSPRRLVLLLGVTATLAAAAPAYAQDPAHRDRDGRHTAYGGRDPDVPADPLGGPLAAAPEYPLELAAPPRLELVQAKRLADAGRHVEAARVFEALFNETGDPRFLYHAGAARIRAGQRTVGLRHWTNFISLSQTRGSLPAHVRTFLDARIAEASAQLVRVRLSVQELVGQSRLAVTIPGGARLTLEPGDGPLEPGVPPIVVTDLAAPLLLDPGGWRVRLELPGFVPLVTRQVTAAGPVDQTWELLLTRETVALELRLSPERAARRAHLQFTPTDSSARPAVGQPADGPRTVVRLTTGPWQLVATSPRWRAVKTIVVGDDPRPVDVALARRKDEDVKLVKDRKLVIGVSASMGVLFYGGLGLTLGGGNVETKARERSDDLLAMAGVDVEADEVPDAAALAALEDAYPTAAYHRDLRRGASIATAGTAVMTAGLGAVIGILPSLTEAPRRRAYVPLAVGGAALVGGAVWMHRYLRLRAERLAPTAPEQRLESSGLVGHRIGSAMILGMGVGLTTGAALLLLTDHLRRRKRSLAAAPWAAPGHAGLVLHGAF